MNAIIFTTLVAAAFLAVANGQTVCQVCGEGKVVTAPTAIFEPPGNPAVTCGDLQQAGLDGQVPDGQCSTVTLLIAVCLCAPGTLPPTGSGTPPPVAAPTSGTPPPVAAPTSGTPPPVAAPTSGTTPPVAAPTSGTTPPVAAPTSGTTPPVAAPTSETAPPVSDGSPSEAPVVEGPTSGGSTGKAAGKGGTKSPSASTKSPSAMTMSPSYTGKMMKKNKGTSTDKETDKLQKMTRSPAAAPKKSMSPAATPKKSMAPASGKGESPV